MSPSNKPNRQRSWYLHILYDPRTSSVRLIER